MNRQLKRANEKSDKKREREQERRKEMRRESRARVTQTKRTAQTKTGQTKDGEKGKAQNERPAPGMGRSRLAGAYLILVIGIIATQALVPQRTDTFSLVTHGLFYLILGYFLVLWFYRRGVEQALVITLAAGLGLSLGVEGLKVLLPQLGLPQLAAPDGSTSAPSLLFVAIALPGLLVGTWFGRYVYKRG